MLQKIIAIIALLLGVDAMVLLGNSRSMRGSSRYFTVEQMLPPLQSASSSFQNSTETIIPYSRSKPFIGRPLPVVYTNDPKHVSQWLSNNIPSSGGTIGFDVESVPNAPWMKQKASFEGPATVQIATPEESLVVHLTRRSGRSSKACAPILEAILSDAAIIKAGAGICDDMLDLYEKWGGLHAQSYWDLGRIAGSAQQVGLQRLTRSILGVELHKSRRLAMSDWSQVPLTDNQLSYSARDAWAAAAICDELSMLKPDEFGSSVMKERLQDQQSLKELYRCRQARKDTKAKLTKLLAPYVRKEKSPRAALRLAHSLEKDSKEVPPSVQVKVEKLRTALNGLSRENQLVFDISPLGIEID